MRDIIQNVEPRNALLQQQINRVRLLGLIERREDIAAVDGALPAALGLKDGVLRSSTEMSR